jgi:hypothetical protein
MMSIRYKIFGVFSIVIVLACGLAFYGIRGISSSGDLVVRLYDGPLMGINHARSAHAALNEAHLIMQRGLSEGASNESVAKFDKCSATFSRIWASSGRGCKVRMSKPPVNGLKAGFATGRTAG